MTLQKKIALLKVNYPEYSKEPISLHRGTYFFAQRKGKSAWNEKENPKTIGNGCLSKFRRI